MKVIFKNVTSVIVEITGEELEAEGFDTLWDNVRDIYPEEDYSLGHVKNLNKGKIVIMELKKNTNNFNIIKS